MLGNGFLDLAMAVPMRAVTRVASVSFIVLDWKGWRFGVVFVRKRVGKTWGLLGLVGAGEKLKLLCVCVGERRKAEGFLLESVVYMGVGWLSVRVAWGERPCLGA